MARPGGPLAISPEERENRVQVAARVRELLGTKPTSELAKHLGDVSRTRAYKILAGQQSITLTLVKELAKAFDLTLVEFLAPLLEPDDAEAVRDDARRRLREEINAKFDSLLSEERARLDRQEVRDLIRWAALAAQHLTPPEIEYDRYRYQLIAEHRPRLARHEAIQATLAAEKEHPNDTTTT